MKIMNFSDFTKKREYLKKLITKENTGTATELAAKLQFSRRTLFNYLNLLREEGYKIDFCRHRRTYFFLSKKEKPEAK